MQSGFTALSKPIEQSDFKSTLGQTTRAGTCILQQIDERDSAKFAKWQSYMVLLDDKVMCANMRCRKRFDISGIKTTAYL